MSGHTATGWFDSLEEAKLGAIDLFIANEGHFCMWLNADIFIGDTEKKEGFLFAPVVKVKDIFRLNGSYNEGGTLEPKAKEHLLLMELSKGDPGIAPTVASMWQTPENHKRFFVTMHFHS